MVSDAFTFSLSGACIARAGTNANSDLIGYGGTAGVSKTILDAWSVETQSLIEAETGMSIGDNFAGYVLSGAASMAHSAKVAMAIISYDTTGYLSREADTLMNNNDQSYKDAIKNMKMFEKTTLSNPN